METGERSREGRGEWRSRSSQVRVGGGRGVAVGMGVEQCVVSVHRGQVQPPFRHKQQYIIPHCGKLKLK